MTSERFTDEDRDGVYSDAEAFIRAVCNNDIPAAHYLLRHCYSLQHILIATAMIAGDALGIAEKEGDG